MGLEATKKEDRGPIIIEIVEFENIEALLSKVLIPFSEVLRTTSVPDVYVGHEKIPFEKRDSLYQTIMRQEFASILKTLNNGAK